MARQDIHTRVARASSIFPPVVGAACLVTSVNFGAPIGLAGKPEPMLSWPAHFE